LLVAMSGHAFDFAAGPPRGDFGNVNASMRV